MSLSTPSYSKIFAMRKSKYLLFVVLHDRKTKRRRRRRPTKTVTIKMFMVYIEKKGGRNNERIYKEKVH